MSGSAYKIAKDRAYHHGTMLISSQLSTLGDVLHVSKVWFICHNTLVHMSDCCNGPQESMITRGVASIRSPVKNLQEFSPAVTHDKFVRAMVQAFREEYHVEEPVRLSHKVISLSFYSSLPFPSGPGAIHPSGGCHKHTTHPRKHS